MMIESVKATTLTALYVYPAKTVLSVRPNWAGLDLVVVESPGCPPQND